MSDNIENRVLADEEEALFTYPEGFDMVANALDFIPDEEMRKQALLGLVLGMLMQ